MSSDDTLGQLAQRFQSMVAGLDVEPYYKSFYTTPQHDGSAHIEARKGGFEFVVTERGEELERIGNLSAEDVLYLLFEGITQRIATKYEFQNRIPGTDGRSVWFPYQESLMESLGPSWGEKLKEKHRRVLTEHPFRT